MATTKIEWANKVWNPITGCTPISEGCAHCYAARMAKRLAGRYGYPAVDKVDGVDGVDKKARGPFSVTFHPDKLDEPLKWKKPCRVFVCSMGDIFHEDVRTEWIDQVLEVIAACPQHTFMMLTKRPENIERKIYEVTAECPCRELGGGDYLPNLWLGVTAETQARAHERIPDLLSILAAKHFISVEPMLGPMVLNLAWRHEIDWVICGGETGPGARPVHPDWVRVLRDECVEARVPFFFKGWGEWLPRCQDANYETGPGIVRATSAGIGRPCCPGLWRKTGKTAASSMVDGREWRQWPVVAVAAMPGRPK